MKSINLSLKQVNSFTLLFTGSLMYVLTMLCPLAGFSQNLNDFKIASESKYIKCIPFPDLRRDAEDIQKDIEALKFTATTLMKYEEYERQKSNNYKEIRRENEEIKSIQNNIATWKAKNADVSVLEKDIDNNVKKIKQYNSNIEALNRELERAINAWNKYGETRGKLREKFKIVLYKLSDAKSSPNQYLGNSPTDDDKRYISGYIDTIVKQIQEEAEKHEVAERECYKAKENFEKVLRKDSE